MTIEDDSESLPHTFDRDLQSLIHQPGFERVRGLAIGRFQKASQMTPDLLRAIIGTKRELRGLPIIADVDFGHTDSQEHVPHRRQGASHGHTRAIHHRDPHPLRPILGARAPRPSPIVTLWDRRHLAGLPLRPYTLTSIDAMAANASRRDAGGPRGGGLFGRSSRPIVDGRQRGWGPSPLAGRAATT